MNPTDALAGVWQLAALPRDALAFAHLSGRDPVLPSHVLLQGYRPGGLQDLGYGPVTRLNCRELLPGLPVHRCDRDTTRHTGNSPIHGKDSG